MNVFLKSLIFSNILERSMGKIFKAPTLIYTTLLHGINVAVKSKIKSISKRHEEIVKV